MKRIFKQLHLWLSLPAGLLLVVLCLTGAVLVFQSDIQQWLSRQARSVTVPPGARPLPLDTLVAVSQREAQAAGKSVSGLTVYADANRAWDVSVAGRKGPFLTIDPYTARVTGRGTPGEDFFGAVRGLHRWLLLDNRAVGRCVMGISTLSLLVILVSGLAVSLPRSWRQWREFLTLRCGRKAFLFWFTSHRALGWYALLFLFLMAATGPMWSFPWYRDGVARVFGVYEPRKDGVKKERKGREAPPAPAPPVATWSVALENVRRAAPDYTSVRLRAGEATVRSPRDVHQQASDTYRFDRRGRITEIQRYADLPASRKVMHYAKLFHFGTWGGWMTKVLYFLACLAGVHLTLSGYWLYIYRQRRRCR